VGLPDEPALMMKGAIQVMRVCVAYAKIDGQTLSEGSFWENQQPKGLEATHQAILTSKVSWCRSLFCPSTHFGYFAEDISACCFLKSLHTNFHLNCTNGSGNSLNVMA